MGGAVILLIDRLSGGLAGLGGFSGLGGMGAGALALAAALLALVVAVLGVLLLRSNRAARDALLRVESLSAGQERMERMVREELAQGRQEQSETTRHLREEVGGSIRGVGESVEKRLDVLREGIDGRLRSIQEDSQKKLDQMRATVDEKLQGTLEKRLGESFRQVSERLEAVHKGLGEMQSLANGVGDLKRVLTNVKNRGTWGEIQLEALLEQFLAPGQWERQVATRRGGAERVDFAVRLPGAEGDSGEPVWLPIDAKFPQEDYQRLLEAQERGDGPAAEQAARALEARLRGDARAIRDKYLNPPVTTDFALLFLPTEGLYAEALRRPGLAEALQRECRVTLAGPMTLTALLNSLQMGFRTLAIQKRSDEVWRLLGAVKTQFGRFGELLAKVEKKLEEASSTIGDASRKSAYIQRRLGKVEELPAAEAAALLPENAEDDARGGESE